ncbi:MAG: hypothetical protein KAH20_10375 [Methylococcales bacterium]|nr:hypothetical protein [Methylococcales bacterium]
MNNQTKKQNTYPSEFKEPAIKLAIESDETITQTDRDDLGVNPQLYNKNIKHKPVPDYLLASTKSMKSDTL